MTGSTEERNTAASICHSSSTGISDLIAQIDTCTNSDELDAKNKLATTLLNLETDMKGLKDNITNSMLMGNSIFGSAGPTDITKEVKQRNADLKDKKITLEKEYRNQKHLIERSQRDFSDVKDQLPETLSNRKLHFVEDYTVAFLFISYLFMICVFITYSTYTASVPITGFFQSLTASAIVSMVMFLLFYYLL